MVPQLNTVWSLSSSSMTLFKRTFAIMLTSSVTVARLHITQGIMVGSPSAAVKQDSCRTHVASLVRIEHRLVLGQLGACSLQLGRGGVERVRGWRQACQAEETSPGQ